VASATEADKIAQAVVNELGDEFVHADARAQGNPEIRVGKLVKLSDLGKYEGSYYITETRHLYQNRIYTTEFSVRGLRGGDLLQTLMPSKQLKIGQTCLVGVVTNNNDEEKKMGRVRVKFPTLTEDHESNWARVVSLGAGAGRGFDCLPEVNDEVLVAFEHGDIHRPYIVGSVWNGKDKPPEDVKNSVANGKVRLRTFKTRAGHTLQFVDEDKDSSQVGVYLKTKYGHQANVNDSEKKIEIKTKNGDTVLLDEGNKKIEIKTNGGHKLVLDDSGKKISLTSTGDISEKSGSGKKIELDAGQIILKGTTKITLSVGSSKIELSASGVKIAGAQVEAAATATAKVKGALTNVEASGITTIKGSLVKIN
jgi:hypothetical protein